MKKMVLLVIMSVVISMVLISTALAADLTAILKCPASVKAGTALKVTVTLENDNCEDPYSITRGIAGYYGNAGGTLADFGIWGPYEKTLSAWPVPKATCDAYDDVITPGRSAAKIVTIATIPAASPLVGKMANATFGVITDTGSSLASGSCVFNVVK